MASVVTVLRSAVLAALLASISSSAWAQDNDGDRRKAGAHVERGDRYKEAGDYERAASEYLAAYELVPHPVLFFNVGQVYRLAKQLDQALEYYQRYLEAEPGGRAADQARAYAEGLRRMIAERDAQGGTGDGGTGDGGGGGSGQGGGGSGGLGSGGTIDAGTDRAPGRTLRLAGMATGGLGLVSLAIGFKFGADARSISNELSDHDGTWTEELLDRQDEGELANRRMVFFAGVGTAAVVAGGVLYYFGWKAKSEERSSLAASPMVGPGQAGLMLSGQF